MEYQRIEDVKNPTVGNIYLVACLIKFDCEGRGKDVKYYTPILNHPHNDKENGQKETHYHIDSRFQYSEKNTLNHGSDYEYKAYFRPEVKRKDGIIEYLPLLLFNLEFSRTALSEIKKSKLKHDCIHKGKCPHRGYDLTNVLPIDGVITCPLHSLRFDEKTHKIIKDYEWL